MIGADKMSENMETMQGEEELKEALETVVEESAQAVERERVEGE